MPKYQDHMKMLVLKHKIFIEYISLKYCQSLTIDFAKVNNLNTKPYRQSKIFQILTYFRIDLN
jgi:hypothetical protein